MQPSTTASQPSSFIRADDALKYAIASGLKTPQTSSSMMMRLISSRSAGARADALQAARRELLRVDLAVDQPARSGQAEAPVSARDGLGGDDLGDVQPRQRRARFDVRQRPVDGVVRADQEISADARELVRGSEHQLAHALPVAAVEAFHVLGERVRVHRDFGMRVRAEKLRAFHADGAIASAAPSAEQATMPMC